LDRIALSSKLAPLLHKWYLEATKNLNPDAYNPDAQKKYHELSDSQRYIDEHIAFKIIDWIEENFD